MSKNWETTVLQIAAGHRFTLTQSFAYPWRALRSDRGNRRL